MADHHSRLKQLLLRFSFAILCLSGFVLLVCFLLYCNPRLVVFIQSSCRTSRRRQNQQANAAAINSRDASFVVDDAVEVTPAPVATASSSSSSSSASTFSSAFATVLDDISVLGAELNRLLLSAPPEFVYRGDGGGGGGGENRECSVCLEDFKEGERLRHLPRCFHCFHVDCVDKWLTSSLSCPVCRSQISVSSSPDADGFQILFSAD